MSKQTDTLEEIKFHESEITALRRLLTMLDREAKEAYGRTLDRNSPNTWIVGWEELTEDERESWRARTN
jgi:hypothetical protein